MRVPDHLDQLGEPDVHVAGLQLWVHGRPFAAETEGDNADWLHVTAYCVAPGARVWTSGSILGSTSFATWLAACEPLAANREGTARLHSAEPDLEVTLTAGPDGHVSLRVFITPDASEQEHRFDFYLDQTHLPPLIAGLRTIVERYPISDRPRANIHDEAMKTQS